MHILFCHDTYYARDKAGQVYAYGAFPYALWATRFLPHFDRITVIGREKAFDAREIKSLDVSSGENIEHVLLPNINAPLKRLRYGAQIYVQIKEQVAKADAVIIRGPVEFGMMAAKAARALGKPYAIEMSGCAFDNVWYHGSKIGKIYAPLKYLRARAMVRGADQVIYVTKDFLQKRYPTKAHKAYASNVEIEAPADEVLARRVSGISDTAQKVTFGLIGNLDNDLKGLHVALEALSLAKDRLPHFELRLLGQGDAAAWEGKIEALGLKGQVVFSGIVTGGGAVMAWLDDIDVYLQPSFHEGLPRGLIEAMSRGCPALGSNAGGISELLDPALIHKKGDAQMLAQHILKMVKDSEMRKKAAQENFYKAQDYTKDKLIPRRAAFWSQFAGRSGEKEGTDD